VQFALIFRTKAELVASSLHTIKDVPNLLDMTWATSLTIVIPSRTNTNVTFIYLLIMV
jgi:hypothetical protein